MRFIKLGLISIVFLFLLVTAISLLLPSNVNISRAIDISAPQDSVYMNLNDVSKWKYWFASYDPNNTTVSAITTGKGATVNMNKTRITITSSSAERIETLWLSGNKSLNGDFNIFKQKDTNQVTVQWHFTQHLRWYPWEKFASIVSDKVMSPAMEKSLDNLKKLVEK